MQLRAKSESMSLVDKITCEQYVLHIPNRKYLTSAEGKEPMREKKAKKGIRELPPQLSLAAVKKPAGPLVGGKSTRRN